MLTVLCGCLGHQLNEGLEIDELVLFLKLANTMIDLSLNVIDSERYDGILQLCRVDEPRAFRVEQVECCIAGSVTRLECVWFSHLKVPEHRWFVVYNGHPTENQPA